MDVADVGMLRWECCLWMVLSGSFCKIVDSALRHVATQVSQPPNCIYAQSYAGFQLKLTVTSTVTTATPVSGRAAVRV